MKITTKIAKNGAVNIYLDGKRVKEEIAVDTLCDNGGKIYFADIHGYTGHTITATFASSISAYKWLIKMGNKSINYADGSWLIDCKDYKTGEIVTILEKDERDYVINDPQLKAFCNGEILEVTQEVVTDDDNAEVDPIITGIKEEQPMTDKLIISAKWNKNDKITAYYINGEKVRKCDIEYYACNHSGIIEVDYHLAQHFRALKYPGEQRKVVYTDYYGQTLMSKAAADELGYKIVKNNSLEIFYVEPIQTDNPDDSSNDEEPDLIVETKRTKRDSINLKLNGSRISLRNLEDCLSNAPTDFFSVINQYGKKYSCYPANNYGYFGESPEGYTIHFNTLGELIEHYAVDNIIHTAEPADQPTNDTPADNRHDTEEPADNPTNDTQDTGQPIDPSELPTAKPRTLRDSLNRAIKQCIRNRISYLKSHNSKMEKYEYELLCLLQGARRELEIA